MSLTDQTWGCREWQPDCSTTQNSARSGSKVPQSTLNINFCRQAEFSENNNGMNSITQGAVIRKCLIPALRSITIQKQPPIMYFSRSIACESRTSNLLHPNVLANQLFFG
ncbi:unnamed protein product [Trichogramma brassicae]|uniref:Uncharacterized protein n=1 Tax=Trichogramma brassicae TaxID=86971 RepID=A0A6H5HZC0_9HYME|nr:unnamed protein product [Trichogramma brassicae]